MALDNPSYFSVSASSENSARTSTSGWGSRGFSGLFRRRSGRKMGTGSSASTTSVRTQESAFSAPGTPTEENSAMLPRDEAQTHKASGPKRAFRNLFRSVSANANDESMQQFLRGYPRPSDVAPPSPYLPQRSLSHTENNRKRPEKRRVLKSTSELFNNDMIYCGLPNEDDVDGPRVGNVCNDEADNEDDYDDSENTREVSMSLDDARYYNISSTLTTTPVTASSYDQRRHSIANCISKERTGSLGVGWKNVRCIVQKEPILVEPSVMAPPIPTEGSKSLDNRRKGKRSRKKRTKRKQQGAFFGTRNESSEEDVVFISSRDSEAAALWVNYLTACFEQISRQQRRSPFRVRLAAIEDPLLPGIEERIKSSRLQIVIVCPVFLEHVLKRPEQTTSLFSCLVTDQVLTMMLGVQDSHVTSSHKSTLSTYPMWRKFFVKDQDETFVGDFLGTAVAILNSHVTITPQATDKTGFSVHPKKVKLGQNRILVLLNDPLSHEDNVSVVVDRCGDAIDITNVKKRNPYVLQFAIPERCLEVSMLVGVRISKNGCLLGVKQVKCESRLRELDQILRAYDNPLEFICQTFGLHPGDREQLDNWMVHAFQKNIPPNFNFVLSSSSNFHNPNVACKNYTSQEETPTLLHFAARFGLEKLAWQLLECPGGDVACDMKNMSEMTPADLAEQAGHSRLAHQLRGYMQMNEFTNMYSYLKVMSERTYDNMSGMNSFYKLSQENDTILKSSLEKEDEGKEYCKPRALDEAYLVPPTARPVASINHSINPRELTTGVTCIDGNGRISIETNYSIVPTPLPIHAMPTPATPSLINTDGLDLTLQGYLQMNPSGSNVINVNTLSSEIGAPSTSRQNSVLSSPFREEVINHGNNNFLQKVQHQPPKSRENSVPQDELLEIINDFKNNVFTISEVERLVDTWRNRNDVQQSFKDKQRQLNSMREEYDRIQKKIKDETKMPTPFDRIRKFFGKGKKGSMKDLTLANEDTPSTSKNDISNVNVSDFRPVSSLSLHSVSSSSSSGHMSTVSGCSGTSLGDSGTHSDPDDRRLQNARDEKIGAMYQIPPAPKPFTNRCSLPRSTPSPRSSTNSDFDLRSFNKTKDFYISFPPSGLPTHAFNSDGTQRDVKTPRTPVERVEFPELENCDLSQSRAVTHRNSYSNLNSSKNQPLPPPQTCVANEYTNSSAVRELVETEKKKNGSDNDVQDSEHTKNDNNEGDGIPEYINVDLKEGIKK